MAWTFDSSSQTWTYTGTSTSGRRAVVFDQQVRGDFEFKVTTRSYLHEVKAVVRMSADGKDGWEIGFASIGNAEDSNLKTSSPTERRYALVMRPIKAGKSFVGADAGSEYDPFWGFPLAYFPFFVSPRSSVPSGNNTQSDYDKNSVFKMIADCGIAVTDVDRPITIKVRCIGTKIEAFLSTQANQAKPILSVQTILFFSNPQRVGFASSADTDTIGFPTHHTDMATTTVTTALDQTPVSDSRFDFPCTADDKWRTSGTVVAGFGAGGTNNATPVALGTVPPVEIKEALLASITERVVPYQSQFCIVAGGKLYVSVDRANPTMVGGFNMPISRPLSGCAFNQRALFVGGGAAYKYDPTAEGVSSVSKWDPTGGRSYTQNDDVFPLPGQTKNTVLGTYEPGTTTAQGIVTHINRVFLFGLTDDPQNIVASANDDEDDFDFDADVQGRAFQTSTEIAGVIGEPIIDCAASRDDRLTIFCTSSTYVMSGDPILNDARTDLVSKQVGVLNQGAYSFSNDGVLYVTTQEGPGVVGGAQFKSICDSRLTKYAYPSTHSGDVYTVVARDSKRRGVLMCYTRVNAAGNALPNSPEYYQKNPTERSVHLWFDERKGGFFPLDFPPGADPICFAKHNDELYIGCRDGRVRTLDDSLRSDEDTPSSSLAIPAWMPLRLVTPEDISGSLKITGCEIVLGATSSASSIIFHTSETIEGAYAQAYDYMEHESYAATLNPGRNTLKNRVKGNAIVATIFNLNVGETFQIDGVTVRMAPAGEERRTRA